MAKDYYKILGVEKNATQEEIKKVFRTLAHKYHPDKGGGDEAKFKEINEAYQVLGNPEKRKQFDQFGTADFNGGAPGGMNWEDIMRQAGFGGASGGGVEFDLGDIFSEVFGGGGRRQRRHQRGADIQMDVTVTFEEAAFGVKKDLELYRTQRCGQCNGNGAEPGTPIRDCKECQGSGVVHQMQRSVFGSVRSQRPCGECNGQGKIPEKKCSTCRGTGVERKTTTLEVGIPAGIDNGQTIRMSGQGEAGVNGGPTGDLYVTVRVVPSMHPWQRDGDDIRSEATVTYTTMVLGGTITVPTLDGEVEVKIPSGTASGTSFRLRNKGIQHLGGGGRGDHYVIVHVSVPHRVGGRHKRLLKELADIEDEE